MARTIDQVPLADMDRIFVRYDLKLAKQRAGIEAKVAVADPALERAAKGVVEGDEEAVAAAVAEALKTKDPLTVINEGLIKGMAEVSRLWDEGVYYLPEVILSSDALMAGLALCEQKLGRKAEKKGKIVMHVAAGDPHDIGKNIAAALLRADGFEVIDLGSDVPVETVVEACKREKPIMVTGTALMTTTMVAFPRIAKRLEEEGINIPFIVSGGAVKEEFSTSFKFGIYADKANKGVPMARDAAAGMSWEEIRAKYNWVPEEVAGARLV